MRRPPLSKTDPAVLAAELAGYGIVDIVALPRNVNEKVVGKCGLCGGPVSPRLSNLRSGRGACFSCSQRLTAAKKNPLPKSLVRELVFADLPLDQISAHSGTKALWQCADGHEWTSTVNDRSKGSGCPSCAGHGFDRGAPAILYVLRHHDQGWLKVGISCDRRRPEAFERRGWSVDLVFEYPVGADAWEDEKKLLSFYRAHYDNPTALEYEKVCGTRIGGRTETFLVSTVARAG